MSLKHILLVLTIVLLAVICAAGMARAVAILGLHVPLDPNEGWNAYHAAAAMGGTLYPGPHSYLINNYPPLSFYLVGAVGQILGDYIVAGRMVSLLALTVLTSLIYTAARRMACTSWQAMFASLFFAAGMIAFTDYVGMNDPQLLAQAIAAAGFVLVLQEGRGRMMLVVAAFLFALAFFVKHNVIAMAIAATAWLAIHQRKNTVILAASGLFFLLSGLTLFHLVYGTGLLTHLLTPRSYSLAQLGDGLAAWLAWNGVPLAGLVGLVWLHRNDPRVRLCAIYTGVSLVTGVGFLGGAGVDVNAMFDADIAVALGAALTLNRLAQGWRGGVTAAAFAMPVLIAAAGSLDDADNWLHPMRDEARTAESDIAFLRARPGPDLCQTLSLCYWAHKPAAVDVFNTAQSFAAGVRNDAELVGMIAARRFTIIQLEPDEPQPLGKNVRSAMERGYRLDHEDDCGSFYVPR